MKLNIQCTEGFSCTFSVDATYVPCSNSCVCLSTRRNRGAVSSNFDSSSFPTIITMLTATNMTTAASFITDADVGLNSDVDGENVCLIAHLSDLVYANR